MSDALIEHFRMLARYNRGANARLYEACSRLGRDELTAQRPAFFGTILGTLNHIMVGDRIWLARFEGGSAPSTGLNAILYDDFADLRRAREAEDARIDRFADGLTRDFLAGGIAYVNNEGRTLEDPATLAVAHFFNHQTHHRGQVTDLLMQTSVAPPVLDMHRVINP